MTDTIGEGEGHEGVAGVVVAGNTAAEETDEDKKRARQQERTVDNLNRLFAMLFSIVFSMAAAAETGKIISFTDKALAKPAYFDVQTTFFNAGALLTLAVTAAVFFHQASRGLDLTYSSSSLSKPQPSALALDFGVITATMVPFVLMARSLDGGVTQRTGFFMFFLAHESLILFGLFWVFVSFFRLTFYPSQSLSAAFRKISIGVQRFWLLVNAVYICATAALFSYLSGSLAGNLTCPVLPNKPPSATFMTAFFLLAVVRNGVDYFTLFKVYFPVKAENPDGTNRYGAFLEYCIHAKGLRVLGLTLPTAGGVAFLGLACYFIFYATNVFDLGKWARVCDMGRP
jgi:hypothetical protein